MSIFAYLKLLDKPKNLFLGLKYFGKRNVSPQSSTIWAYRLWTTAVPMAKKKIEFSEDKLEPWLRRRQTKLERLIYKDILVECGIREDVDKKNYTSTMRSSVIKLKEEGLLLHNADVPQRLIEQFKDAGLSMESQKFDDSMRVETIRLLIVKMYLKKVLNMEDDEFDRLFNSKYSTILSRPLRVLKEVCDLLMVEYKLNATQVKQNINLLKTNPDELRDITKFRKSVWHKIVNHSMKRVQPWKYGAARDYIRNIKSIFDECGLDMKKSDYREEISDILYSPVGVLKKMGYIPMDVDVPKRLSKQFEHIKLPLDSGKFDESMPLGTIRYFMLKMYMTTVMGFLDEQFKQLNHHYLLCEPLNDHTNHCSLVKLKAVEKRPSQRQEPWLPFRHHKVNEKFYIHNLYECGVQCATQAEIDQYNNIMQSTVKHLKDLGFLPANVNIAEHLANQVKQYKVPIDNYELNDTMRLGTIRYFVLRMFVNRLLGITEEEHDELLKKYNRAILVRPLSNVHSIYKVLTSGFGFQPDELRQKLYLFGCVLENIRNFLEMKEIAGTDVRIIAKTQPWLLMRDSRNFPLIINQLRSFDIPEEFVKPNYEILRLQPKILHQRLSVMKNHEELKTYFQHPRFLAAIVHYDRVMARLECMKVMPERRTTFNFLIQPNDDVFIRQLRNGMQFIYLKEQYQYFAKFFEKPLEQVETAMTLHPYGLFFSIKHIKQNIDYLMDNGFSKEDIFKEFYITIYPREKIVTALKQARDEEIVREKCGVELSELPKSMALKICGIIMEWEFNFSGEGCWPDSVDATKLTNLPDEEYFRKILNKHRKKKGKIEDHGFS